MSALVAAFLLLGAAPAAADQVAFVRDSNVTVRDIDSGLEVGLVNGRDPGFGPGGARIVAANSGGILSGLHDGRCLSTIVHGEGLREPALSADAMRLLYVAPSIYGPLVRLRDLATGGDRIVGAGTSPRWQGSDAPQTFFYLQNGTIRSGDVNDPTRTRVLRTGIRGRATFDTEGSGFVIGDDRGVVRSRFGGDQVLAPDGANPSALGTSVYFDAPGGTATREIQVVDVDGTGRRTVTGDATDPAAAPSPRGGGYRVVASDGGVFSFGTSCFQGSTGDRPLNAPIVDMAERPDGAGYWLVASDGGIFTFGTPFHGSTGAIRLNQPIVGMAATPSGQGYWLLAADGGVFRFGDAGFHGAATGRIGAARAVALVATATGRGYWIVTSDGRIVAFGDADLKDQRIFSDSPITDAARAGRDGLVLLGQHGGVFAVDTDFHGSRPGVGKRFVGIRTTTDGYWLFSADGSVFSFGDATYFGSLGAVRLNRPIVGA